MNFNGEYITQFVPVGSKRKPGVCFDGETSTGIYLDTPGSSSQFSISKRGTKRFLIDDTKTQIVGSLVTDTPIVSALEIPSGTPSAPGLSYQSSTSSGLYLESGSKPAISHLGNYVARFGSDKVDMNTWLNMNGNTVGCGGITSTGVISAGSNAITGGNLGGSSLIISAGGTGQAQADSVVSLNSMKAGDQSISAPSYSFNNQPSMGMYRAGLNELVISDGSHTSGLMTLNSSGVVLNDAFTCQTHPLTCGAAFPVSVSCSDTMSVSNTITCGTLSTTGTVNCTAVRAGTSGITTTGGFSCSLAATVPALACTSLTSSGTMSCGTNAMTSGALSCTSMTSSGTISCGTNAMTSGALSCTSVSSSGNITGQTLKLNGLSSSTSVICGSNTANLFGISASSSWTPQGYDGTFTFTDNGSTGIYTQVGPMMFIQGVVAWSNLGSAVSTNFLKIRGLPLAPKGNSSVYQHGQISFGSGTFTINGSLSLRAYGGLIYMDVIQTNPTTGISSLIQISNVPTSGSLSFFITYAAN